MSVFPNGGQAKSVLPWGVITNNFSAGFWEKMVVPYGLVAYQDFDLRYYTAGSYFEGEFYDLATTASVGLFVSANGNTKVGTPGTATGPFQTCITFDGSAGSYASFQSSTTGLPTGSTPRSFVCWFEVPNFTNAFSPIIYGTNTNNQYFQVYTDKTGGSFGAGKLVFSDSGTGSIVSTPTITAGAPQHIAVITTSTNLASTKLYINGSLVTSTLSGSDNTLNTIQSANYHYLNAVNATPTGGGAGQIMELRMYNRAIDDSEVLELYVAGLAGRNTWYTQYSELGIFQAQATNLLGQILT